MLSKRVSMRGRGADLFFGDHTPTVPPPSDGEGRGIAAPPADAATTPARSARPNQTPSAPIEPTHDQHDPRQAPQPDRDATDALAERADTIEAIRKTVKPLGREVAFTRLTAEEKTGLADIVDAQRRQGCKTTENEITRIAIASLVRDYQAHGARSVLAQVLAALRA